jgi:hypothetical protein
MKRLFFAKIFKCVFASSIVCCVVSIIFSFVFEKIDHDGFFIGSFCISSLVAYCFGGIYFISLRLTENSYNLLKAWNLEKSIDGIAIDGYTLEKSKIFCANEFFFCRKRLLCIPYSAVSWIYVKRIKYVGKVADEEVIVCCKTGDSFSLNINKEEREKLLLILSMKSPEIIVGYSIKNENEYGNIVREYNHRIKTQNIECNNNKNDIKRKAKIKLLIFGGILLSFIVMVFAIVIFSDESDINSPTYDTIDDLKTEYTVGYTVDECYFNEWCKIKFQIPNGWSMVEGADEFDDESKIATALSYENEHNLVSMFFDRTIGNNTTTDDYLLAIEEQLKDDYSVNGVSVDSTEIYDFLIADTNFRTIKISLADGMCYQYFSARQIDNCIILIDVFAESITEAEKIFNMFEYYEG